LPWSRRTRRAFRANRRFAAWRLRHELSGFIRPHWQVYPTNPQRSRRTRALTDGEHLSRALQDRWPPLRGPPMRLVAAAERVAVARRLVARPARRNHEPNLSGEGQSAREAELVLQTYLSAQIKNALSRRSKLQSVMVPRALDEKCQSNGE
jgi:hypothetical protein